MKIARAARPGQMRHGRFSHVRRRYGGWSGPASTSGSVRGWVRRLCGLDHGPRVESVGVPEMSTAHVVLVRSWRRCPRLEWMTGVHTPHDQSNAWSP